MQVGRLAVGTLLLILQACSAQHINSSQACVHAVVRIAFHASVRSLCTKLQCWLARYFQSTHVGSYRAQSPSCYLRGLQVELQGDDIHYTRSIAPAAANADSACSHYGILLARTAGLPQHITDRAMQVCSAQLCQVLISLFARDPNTVCHV
jgi:hypothetical protein